MHVIISIDDLPDGEISVKTLVHPALVDDDAPAKTPAVELGDFLQAAIDLWRDTLTMDEQQLQIYLQTLFRSTPHH